MMGRAFGVIALALALGAPCSAFAQGLPHTFTAGTPARAEEVNENFRYVAPKSIVYVNPVEGGSATSNGDALKAALNMAKLTAINGAPAAGNRYLVKVAPGIYDVGSDALSMQSHVDLMGAGPSTVIRGSNTSHGVVRGATNCALSHVTVEATGAGTAGISASNVTMRIDHVDVRLSGSPVNASGIAVSERANVDLHRVSITVSSASPNALSTTVGLRVTGPVSGTPTTMVTADDVTIAVTHNSASAFLVGVALLSGARFEGNNVRVSTVNSNAAATSVSLALHAHGNNTLGILRNGLLESKGGASGAYPLRVESPGATLRVHHSILTNHSNANFLQNSGGEARVAASQTNPGAAWIGTGSVACVYVYNANFATESCQNLQ